MAKGNLTTDAVDKFEEGLSSERLRSLIEEQGIKPITPDQLHAMGDFWPEDESIDDFIAAVREWRRDGSAEGPR